MAGLAVSGAAESQQGCSLILLRQSKIQHCSSTQYVVQGRLRAAALLASKMMDAFGWCAP